MLTLNSIFIFSENPQKLNDFYKSVFEKEPEWNEGGYTGFQVGSLVLMIGPHDKVHGMSQNPERILLNFDSKNVEEEFNRIEKLGAKVIAKPYHPMENKNALLATFADPDGNYFQLATPWEQ